MPTHWKHLVLIGLLCALVACGDDDDDDVIDAGDVVDAASNIDGGDCVPNDGACTGPADCCSGECSGDICVPPVGCALAGEPCDTPSDCCAEAQCEVPAGGSQTVCIPGLCTPDSGSCDIDADCCSLNCDGTTCGSSDGACLVRGDDCTDDADCCSHNCAGTCAGSTASCDPIGESCTSRNQCCSDFCANTAGEECTTETDCRCLVVTDCRAEGEICANDGDCCNDYCDWPDGDPIGHCASLGACSVVGEPCGEPGVSSACCSNACVDSGVGVATCEFLGGCLPINEICTDGAQCCSGSCVENGTTTDGRPVMRCDDAFSCLMPGEVCFTGASANCCPAGGGSTGCEPAVSGVHRCFGGDPSCTLPGQPCTDVSECCMDIPGISCEEGPGGENICCLPDGTDCSFGDLCCSGVCAPDDEGNLVCNPGGCVDTGGACTTNSDCCEGCCKDDGAGGMACSTDCAGCTLGQLGDLCGDEMPCCPGLLCTGDVEFPTCQLE